MPGNKENVGEIEIAASINIKAIRKDLKKLTNALNEIDPKTKKAEMGMRNLEKSTKKTATAAKDSAFSFKKLFSAFTLGNIASSTLMRAIRGVRNAFVGAIKGAIDFQAQMIQVRKVTGATASEIKNLRKFISGLSVQTGIAKAELSGIAAAGGRLGIFAREGASGLEEFTRVLALSRIAMEDFASGSEEAADKTARLVNLFGLESKDAEVLLSIMNELSNTAAATASNIADNVTNFAALSQSFQASKESLLALATTMEDVGAEPQAFSTGFQTVLIEMQKDTDKFAKFLGDEMGPKFKEVFADEPVEAFAIFLEGLRKTGRDIGPVLEKLGIGDRRLTRELSKLATDKGLQRFASNLKTAKEESKNAQDAVDGLNESVSSLQQEFDRASDSTKRRAASLGEALSNLGNAFGKRLQPAMDEFLDAAISGFGKLESAADRLGGSIGNFIEKIIILRKVTSESIEGIVKGGAGLLRKPFEALGIAEGGAADVLLGESFKGTKDLIKKFRGLQGVIEKESKKTGEVLGADLFGGDIDIEGIDDEKGGAAKRKKTLQDFIKLDMEHRKQRLNFMSLEIELGEKNLEAKRDTVGLTEKEEMALRRMGRTLHRLDGLSGDAFDVREAEDFNDALSAMNNVAGSIEDSFDDITKSIEKTSNALNDMIEDSKSRVKDLALEISDIDAELKKLFGGDDKLGERQEERVKRLAEALIEAENRRNKGEETSEDKETIRQINELLFPTGRDQELTEGFGKEMQKALRDAIDELREIQDETLIERIKREEDAEDELLKTRLENKKKEHELQVELEEAFQEGKLEEFLKAHDEELTAKQRAFADEIMARRNALEAQLAEEKRVQDEIVTLFIRSTNIKDGVAEAFNEREISRLEALQVQAVATIKAIAAARRAAARAGAASAGAGFAGGGIAHGPGGPTGDQIPAMLSDGEGIVRTKAVNHYGGRAFIDALNSMSLALPHFADGGQVSNSTKTFNLNQTFNGSKANRMQKPSLLKYHGRRAFR